VQVRRDEQRVVIEHLLEVRDEPALVDRVAVKAATDQVVHPAERHPVERPRRHLLLPAAQQELERRGLRELRRRPPSAPARVEALAQPAHGDVQQLGRQRIARRRELGRRAHGFRQRLRLPRDVAAALSVRVRDRAQHLLKRRKPVARLVRKVRAADERLAVRRQEDRHRPPAATGERHDGVHIQRVDIRPLLAVDLHADEAFVHHLRSR
jgi:hypothetical protein